MAANFDRFGQPIDPLSPQNLRKENRAQLLSDILRNASGVPEAALTMGTGLADMAGSGLGTLAGMAKQRFMGEKPDLDAATETMQEGKFTFQPRTEGGKEFARGLGTVMEPLERGMQAAGQKTADVTGSPAAGAAVYTALNVLDPELLAPAAAKVAALRGASNIARGAAETAVPMGEALRNVPVGQRGAYTLEDLSGVEGDFAMRSTVEDALAKLKPQEQKARGKQMRKVLEKYGAKKAELEWSGLGPLLDQDIPVTADDVREHMQRYGVQVGEERFGASAPEVEKGGTVEWDADEINEKAYDLAREDSDLEYPETWTVYSRDIGDNLTERTFETKAEAQEWFEEWKRDTAENEVDYYLTERGPEDVDNWDSLTDEEKQSWAEEAAQTSVDEHSVKFQSEIDYDSDPSNLEELQDYWRQRIEEDPEQYNISSSSGIEKGKWDEYALGAEGREIGERGTNYGETIATLQREGKFGRGVTDDLSNTPAEPVSALRQAQIDTLREKQRDPMQARAAEPYKYQTHFPTRNPLVYTRESTMPKPPGAATEGDMRFIEELQSDWGQFGRKKGIYDPEEAAAKQAKRIPEARAKLSPYVEQSLALYDRLDPGQQKYVREEMASSLPGFNNAADTADADFRAALMRVMESDDVGAMAAVTQNFPQRVYWSATNPDVETQASTLRRQAENEAFRFESEPKGLPPAPFIGDVKQWGKLGLQKAIIDAVRRGDQYVGWTPGYTHAPERWGSEDLSWWTPEGQPTPADPASGQMGLPDMPEGGPQPKRMVASRNASYDTTRGEDWKQKIAALRRGEPVDGYNAPSVAEIDPFSPDAEQQMYDIVDKHLSYEASHYADPEQFKRDRAAKILANMRKEAEGQYSPRLHGMNEFYDKQVPSIMESILKEAGSTGSGAGVVRGAEAGVGQPMAWQRTPEGEWEAVKIEGAGEAAQWQEKAQQNPEMFRYEPPRMHYVEIDPELARAAKRGFRLPF